MAKKMNKEVELQETAPNMEEATVKEAAPKVVAKSAPTEEHVDFETWYAAREAAIPAHHHREILKADFAGRKVPAQATMTQFDAALEKYGVKLA